MGCKIIFSPQAIADLEAAVRFIADDNPEVAVSFGNVLIDRVAILENFPLIGSPLLPARSVFVPRGKSKVSILRP